MANLLDLLQIVQEPIPLLIVVIYLIGTSLIYLIRGILVNPPSFRRTLASLLLALLIIPTLIAARPYLPFRVSDLFFILFALMAALVIFVLLMPPGGVTKSLRELIQYVLSPLICLIDQFLVFWSKHQIVFPITLIVFAIVCFVLITIYQSRPEPFRVNIELEKAGSVGDGSGEDNLKAALDDLESTLRNVHDIEVIVDPVEDTADLSITLMLNNDNCRDKNYIPDQWQWDASTDLEQILEFLQLDERVAHTEDEKNLCNWTRTRQDLEALILIAFGLKTYYLGPKGSNVDAVELFENASAALSYLINSEEALESLDEEELALKRRMLNCAKVMAVIADGTSLNINERKTLKDVVAKDPFEDGKPLADYCIAQAYYGLGRGEIEHHLRLLQENPEKAAQALEAAIQYFDQALYTYDATTSSAPGDGFQWSYFFYRGLARYRLGQFERARQDLKLAEDSHEETPINHIALDTISYLLARFELEELLYSSLSDPVCAEPRLPDSQKEQDPLSRLQHQKLQNSDSIGLAPLSVGALSLLSEARYWEALALCDPIKRANHSAMAIEKAQAARIKIDSGTKYKGVTFEPSVVDIFLDHLYVRNGRDDNSTSSVGRHIASYNKSFGVPAYVIPLPVESPWPLRWLVRNSYDEPLFDFSPLINGDEPDFDSNCAGIFCAQLDDGEDNTTVWALSDRGYGLFEAEPPSGELPYAQFTAEPGEKRTIVLRSALHTSLIYHPDEADPVEIYVGSIPITSTAVLSAEVKAEWNENAVDCDSCYEIDIELLVTSEEYVVTGLSTNGVDGLPTLIFKATLFEGTLPLDEPLSNDNYWQPVGGSFITLPIQNGNGRFKGSFGTVLLDTTRHHAVRIFVEDRQGNEILNFWVKDFEIRIPA